MEGCIRLNIVEGVRAIAKELSIGFIGCFIKKKTIFQISRLKIQFKFFQLFIESILQMKNKFLDLMQQARARY